MAVSEMNCFGGGGSSVDMGWGATFSAIKHLSDDTTAINSNKIVCGFKPKKIYLSYRYNGSQLWCHQIFYNADDGDTYTHYTGKATGTDAATKETETIGGTNATIVSIGNDGFTIESSYISYLYNIGYLAVG